MKYLKDYQHYEDRYDLFTIRECLDYYWGLKDGMKSKRKKLKKMSNKKFEKETHKVVSYFVNVIKGERYRNKAETIKGWMDKDKGLQDLLDNSEAPWGIDCLNCGSSVKVIHKSLHDSYEENPRVLFMFECKKCKKRQAHYDDGTKWEYEPSECPKCKSPMDHRNEDKKDKLVTYYSCTNCSYMSKDVMDFNKTKEERQKREKEDEELLGKYRKQFCLDDKEGQQYITSMDGIMSLVKEWEGQKKKDKDPKYHRAKNLKKLKIVKLKELLSNQLEKYNYIDLQFGKPEMGGFVIIDFTINDSKEDREDYESRNTLRKLIQKELKKTNWRLMSDGIEYRLGILSGRLKAYEREEDLIKIVD